MWLHLRQVARLGLSSIKAPLALLAAEPKAIIPIQKLSTTQMKERREKGLCYNCDDKWAPGHKCHATKLFIMECENSDDEDEAKSTPW